MDIQEALDKIVETLEREYDPEKVIVFGSHARGEAGPESDIDLFIIKQSDKREVERIREVSRLLRPRPASLDILVKTPEEIEHRLAIGDSFVNEVMREGRVVYERP